jgi:hypothetical protein
MQAPPLTGATSMLEQEARALMTRLARVQPFALQMPMVTAAAIPSAAQLAIERHMLTARRSLRGMVLKYLSWLRGEGRMAPPENAQRRFTFLRMRFNSVLTQFDIFADVISQRSQHLTGVWMSGLDVAAADALQLPDRYFEPPPVVCYLDRGHGAAIRRARTRLPGGDQNPVAIIRVPRERMVGSGIGSSLFHEVGHQGAALLDLVNSLRPVLQRRQRAGGNTLAWKMWERWISEIVADFWSVSRLGISSTLGLIGVVTLPRVFVFRAELEDPHPMPWVRVKLSCAMGHELYPHPQWAALSRVWESLYPPRDLDEPTSALLGDIQTSMPEFVSLLVNHRPKALQGRSLKEVFAFEQVRPASLAERFASWQPMAADRDRMLRTSPSVAFAVLGQARAEGKLSPEDESRTLERLLFYWAVRSTLGSATLQTSADVARSITSPGIATRYGSIAN